MKNKIKELVYCYKTKYENGFTTSEVMDLLKHFPNINIDKFEDALNGNTCMIVDENIIRYHHDIEIALRCGIENRDLHSYEFD